MLKCLWTITRPSGDIGVFEGVECSFVLKSTSITVGYGRMRILRC